MCSTTPVFCCVHSTAAINSVQQMVSKWHWFCKKTLRESIWLKQANRQGKREQFIQTRRVQCRGGEGGHMGNNRSDRTNGTCGFFFSWKTEEVEGKRMLKEYISLMMLLVLWVFSCCSAVSFFLAPWVSMIYTEKQPDDQEGMMKLWTTTVTTLFTFSLFCTHTI